jgi:hypothetical protein
MKVLSKKKQAVMKESAYLRCAKSAPGGYN